MYLSRSHCRAWAVWFLPAVSLSRIRCTLGVLLHQRTAFFQEGQGVKDKAICQGGLLIFVDCLEGQVIEKALKDGNLFGAIVDKR